MNDDTKTSVELPVLYLNYEMFLERNSLDLFQVLVYVLCQLNKLWTVVKQLKESRPLKKVLFQENQFTFSLPPPPLSLYLSLSPILFFSLSLAFPKWGFSLYYLMRAFILNYSVLVYQIFYRTLL